jgi:putative FmdB family regulatory protein
MPIYEYECEKCRRVLNFLVRNTKEHKRPACPKCGHKKMHRVLSRFASMKGGAKGQGDESIGNMNTPAGSEQMPDMSMLDGVDENDSRSIGRIMRKLAEESGEQMPPEMGEMCRRLEAGEDPEKIQESMGDLLGEESNGPSGRGGADNMLYEA